ncbi:hypothetical protein [Bdellovibrio sp. NC01]|uniref:hypothetical protein n=1 Tax=Bdellovibrio sp. NC01 TaxID=2220073 RepID=UPI00115BF497|nr:hypothetical protein [Bdellovibrio sp. NC01]QDK38018.1 hypothetical protein DOE51_10675 [Bdellovibrio sp. NC01]
MVNDNSSSGKILEFKTFSKEELPELIRIRVLEFVQLICQHPEHVNVVLAQESNELNFSIYCSEEDKNRLETTDQNILASLEQVVEGLTFHHGFRGSIKLFAMNVL